MDISILLIAFLALILNWFAYRKGFYRFYKEEKKEIPVSLKHLLGCFGIYLIFSLMLAPFFAKLFLNYLSRKDPAITSLSISTISGIQLITMCIILSCLLLFMLAAGSKLLMRIWKDNTSDSIVYDFGMGIIAWFLSFPVVVVINDLLDYLIVAVFGPKQYEQAAVRFVKTAMQNPEALIMSMLSVLVFAPIIEEFLFRGCLQNYLKQRLGYKVAVQISAFCFAIFHLTPSQGIGNFSFAISLFILGLFLGFLYEKQGSLFAPIGLHMTFNVVSAMRILFIPES